MSHIPRRRRTVILIGILALALTACAASANPQAGSALNGAPPAGVLLGLWHGLIAPVTFVISLFSDQIGIYEVHNNGAWYDGGFVLGLGFLVGGGSSGVHAAR